MKRNAYWCVIASLFALLAPIAFAQDKSDDLAAYARQQKKDKQAAPAPAKVYDDDNLPKTEHISVVGSEPPATPADGSSASATQDSGAQPSSGDTSTKSDDKTEAGQSQEDRQQANTDWENKIKEQKKAVDLAQRELDVVQREYRLKQAVVASDVGYRLRNAAQWDKEDKQYKEQIAAKQKSFDDAKQKLTTLQEDARKSGVPTKMRE